METTESETLNVVTALIDPRAAADWPNSEGDRRHIRLAILQHIARYRLSTFEVMGNLPECQDLSNADLRRLLKELVHFELLLTATLHRGRSYWALAAAGAKRCGVPDDRTGFLSEPAKRRAYAILRFCHQSGVSRRRLNREELDVGLLSHVARPGMPSTYYIAGGASGRIGLARIDIGRAGRWDRILQTVRNDCDQHRNASAWRPFLQANRFEITVLTALPQKAARLQQKLQEMALEYRIPLQATALPELLPLMPQVGSPDSLS